MLSNLRELHDGKKKCVKLQYPSNPSLTASCFCELFKVLSWAELQCHDSETADPQQPAKFTLGHEHFPPDPSLEFVLLLFFGQLLMTRWCCLVIARLLDESPLPGSKCELTCHLSSERPDVALEQMNGDFDFSSSFNTKVHFAVYEGKVLKILMHFNTVLDGNEP